MNTQEIYALVSVTGAIILLLGISLYPQSISAQYIIASPIGDKSVSAHNTSPATGLNVSTSSAHNTSPATGLNVSTSSAHNTSPATGLNVSTSSAHNTSQTNSISHPFQRILVKIYND